MDTFTQAYVECLLWSTTAHGDEIPEDSDRSFQDLNYDASDLSPETLAQVSKDCSAFQSDNALDLALVTSTPEPDTYSAQRAVRPLSGWTMARMGHDFWLTREGHGAGFWDEYYGADKDLVDAFKRLTDASRPYGSFDLYLCNGKVCS